MVLLKLFQGSVVIIPQSRSRLFVSTFFPIHYLQISLLLEALELLRVSLNKPDISGGGIMHFTSSQTLFI
jgi:hypothetical protein